MNQFQYEKFVKGFLEAPLEENCQTDTLGHKVDIPIGYSFKIGADGFGIAVGPCDAVKADKVGRIHAVPKGYVLKIGKNGKGVVVAPNEPTRQTKEGQLELLKRLNKAKPKAGSC